MDNKQRTFKGDASVVAFPLGGIGTGNISVGARGELRDWEIFNKPNKGSIMYYSFFSIRAQEKGKKPISKILESKYNPPFAKSHGFHSGSVAGLPRFEHSELKGEYPVVWVKLSDESMPVEVTLEAFTPMIPLNPDDSGIPCAILKYKVKNIADSDVDVDIAGSLLNVIGFSGYDKYENLKQDNFTGAVNEFKEHDGFKGLYFYSKTVPEDDLKYGNMSLVTTSKNVSHKVLWENGDWWDGIHAMWDEFTANGKFDNKINEENIEEYRQKIGSICVSKTIAKGEEKEFQFILSWYFPNRINGWNDEFRTEENTKNYYANLFDSSLNVCEYVINNFDRLYNDTFAFHDALFGSSLPSYVIDAISANMVTLRSNTCFRLQSGKFLGYEGCFDDLGCCDGNCTHVWNYEQTLAFLYPSLERDMRVTEFNIETEENGKMEFRTKRLFGYSNNFHPAADGQMGCIIRLYRDWKLSGDNEFLRSVWDNAKKALEFAFTYWDSDGDNVLDSQQHNTYDIEFYGPNSLVNSMFFGALKAASEMAEAMGDKESSEKYAKMLKDGSGKMDKMLWNGEYYSQKIDDVNKYKYQYGEGCLSDQLFGQLSSHIAGLGYILPEEHVKKAIYSVYKYNFLKNFSNHNNVQRVYALNDEKGVVLCSWPNGGRPRLPFVYSDEVWTGIEYQVAVHLIFEGFVNEGLEIVKAVRERHDGYKRNPWNEVECGHHYARAMSSWGLLIALSGFKFDLTKKVIEFNPVVKNEDFSCLFSCGKAWGKFTQKYDKSTGEYKYKVDVIKGSLNGIHVKARGVNVI